MSVATVLERADPAEIGPAPNRSALPVLPALAPLLPRGELRRGSTITVAGSTALVLALLAGPSAAGSWCAVVGVPTLGARAAGELGVRLDRLALVPSPGGQWSAAVAALFDGMDVVAVRPPARVSAGEARRLAARARERGCVLIPLGPWDGAELRLTVAGSEWSGLGTGFGRLHARRIRVEATGRGAAARPRRAEMWLPARDGGIEATVDVPLLHSVSGSARELAPHSVSGSARELAPHSVSGSARELAPHSVAG